MEHRHATPRELVQALHERREDARRELQDRLGAAVAQLMGTFLRRHSLPHDPGVVSARALHAGEMYLRARPPAEFEDMSWRAFQGTFLFHVSRLACQPFDAGPERRWDPDELPQCLAYESRTLFLPYEKVGPFWCGGDWCGGLRGPDGSLWVMVADVTGHGYCAYLLASSLPGMWKMCWQELAAGDRQPAEVLGAMHELLADCLPEGVYVEGTVARFGPDGRVLVGAAGGCRLLLRQGGAEGPVACHTIRGGWLGLVAPDPHDQGSWSLGHGDELLLASDGLFEQMAHYAGSVADFVGRLGGPGGEAPVFERVRAALDEALRAGPQRDDITLVMVRRQAAAVGEAVSQVQTLSGGR